MKRRGAAHVNATALTDREAVEVVRSCPTEGWTVGIYIEWPSEFFLMPHFDRELIEVMRDALEEAMAKVPWEYSTSATKAYLAECILKAAAQGQTSYDQLVAAAADQIDQIQVVLSPFI